MCGNRKRAYIVVVAATAAAAVRFGNTVFFRMRSVHFFLHFTYILIRCILRRTGEKMIFLFIEIERKLICKYGFGYCAIVSCWCTENACVSHQKSARYHAVCVFGQHKLVESHQIGLKGQNPLNYFDFCYPNTPVKTIV